MIRQSKIKIKEEITEAQAKGGADDAHAPMGMPSRKTRNPSGSSSSAGTSSPPDGSSLSRQQRNLAEKQRRDKLNSYINELANLVPMVAASTKKLDKTSVLRLSAAHLRLYYSCLNPKNCKKVPSWRPNVFETEHLNELLKAINGFLLVTTTTAKIIFTSKYVENYLGHQDIEMIGHSLFYFIHPDDHCFVRSELKKLALSFHQDKKNSAVRCVFCARMKERSQPRSEIENYQLMRFNCTYSIEENFAQNHPKLSISGRHAKHIGVDLVGGIVKYYIQTVSINPFDELSITEAFQEEYVTRHGLSGEILYADHRISTITGHLPHEVIGMLAYNYIFPEDVPVAQFAQKLMFSSSDGRGAIVYRLRSRDSTAIYLKTFGQLQYDKSSTKVSHFICINKLLSEKEGKEELKKFNERYSPRINEFLAYSHTQPPPLNSGSTFQAIQNGSTLSDQPTSLSSDLYCSPYQNIVCHTEQFFPVLSADAHSMKNNLVVSPQNIYQKDGFDRVIPHTSNKYGDNHHELGSNQSQNGADVFHKSTLLEADMGENNKASNNISGTKENFGIHVPFSQVRIQDTKVGNGFSTFTRKRTADMISRFDASSPTATVTVNKLMKYHNGVSDQSDKHLKLSRNSNLTEQRDHIAVGIALSDKEWLNLFGNCSAMRSSEQQSVPVFDSHQVLQNCCDSKKNSWTNCVGSSSCSGDESTTVLSPDPSEMGSETIDLSNSDNQWLEGALQVLYHET